MPVPVSQMATVASYVLGQKLRGVKRYPLVLMLEPLYRCNLACAGCGKIQYPSNVLKHQLSVEDCMRAVEECPAPVVSIPGGEPLLHPQIDEIVRGLVARKKYIYLCTNALLLEEKLDLFEPTKYLSFSVHMDGLEDEHDSAVCREGTYRTAYAAIEKALARGFRVTTNTTLFEGADPERTATFFDEMMRLGVEGMMISPGYSYEKAPDQEHFLGRGRTIELFRRIFDRRDKPKWRFNQSPLFVEFLLGERDYECTPWGNPTYSVFGWQKPCYLLQEGYADSFQELIDDTRWQDYGPASGNAACQDCMVHCGFEASAVEDTFSSFRGLGRMARAFVFGPRTPKPSGAPAESVPAVAAHGAAHGAPDAATPGNVPPTRHLLPTRGWAAPGSPEALRVAFEYRGDVTLRLDDGSVAEGFVANLGDDAVRLWRKGSTTLEAVSPARVRHVELSGPDPASGKSFETFVKRKQASSAPPVAAAAAQA